MAWGVFMGNVAIGADPLQIVSDTASASSPQKRYTISTWALCTASVLWTLFTEIIYSHQDAAHDASPGVKNIVLLYDGKTKPIIGEVRIRSSAATCKRRLVKSGWLVHLGCYRMRVCGHADGHPDEGETRCTRELRVVVQSRMLWVYWDFYDSWFPWRVYTEDGQDPICKLGVVNQRPTCIKGNFGRFDIQNPY